MNFSSFVFFVCISCSCGLQFMRSPEETRKYLNTITRDDYVRGEDVGIYSETNGTLAFSKGFNGIVREIDEGYYNVINDVEVVWVVTTTTINTGVDENGPVDSASVVTTKKLSYYLGDDNFWVFEGYGTMFIREDDEDYKVVGSITVRGSGHEDFHADNTSSFVDEAFQIDETEEGVMTTIVYVDYALDYMEDKIDIKGFETIRPEPEEFKEFPVQVNEVEVIHSLIGVSGKVSEVAEGTIFADKDDDETYSYNVEGVIEYGDLPKLKHPVPHKFIRSTFSPFHKYH